MRVNMPRIHPLIEQIHRLALAGAFDAGDQDQHGEATLLLEVKLRVKQCLPQLCFLAAVDGLVDVMLQLGGFEHVGILEEFLSFKMIQIKVSGCQ